MASPPRKGKYKPKNPQKYKGDPRNIIYRSGWERDVMKWLDDKDNVLWWQSEEKCFWYRDELRKQNRRYFPDFIVCFQRDYGEEIRVIEVKPKKYCAPPKTPKRKTKSYYYHMEQYLLNQMKWKSMEKICEDRGWNFSILTEDDVKNWNK